MKLQKVVLSFAPLFLLNFVTNAMIYETNTLQDVIKYASSLHFNSPDAYKPIPASKILTIFDVDNTLAEPLDEVASDQCFSALLKRNVPLRKILRFCHTAQKATNLKPIEETRFDPQNPNETILGTIDTIRFLQKWGFKTMVLTARSSNIYECTLRQFAQNLKIDFTDSSPYPRALYRKSEITLNTESDEKGDCRFLNGTLFSGNHNKGLKLIQLLKHIGYHPKAIIFVDDKQKNLENVRDALQKDPYFADVIFIGLRYGACDEKVKSFELKSHHLERWKPLASRPNSPLFDEVLPVRV